MHVRCLLIAALLVCFGSLLHAQEKQPDAKPKGISKETAAAWKKRGFDAGWMFVKRGRLDVTAEYPKDAKEAIPALWWGLGAERDMTDDDLKDLPAVEIPFALHTGGRSKVTDTGLEHIAALKNLAWLDVRVAQQVGGEGLKQLASLEHLTVLDLSYTRLTDVGTMHLAGFKHLTRLHLDGTKITDEGLKDLAGLKTLTVLELSNTSVTDEGLKHLAGLTNLTELELNVTHVTDDGLKHLAGLTNLTTINLWETGVHGANLKPLAGLKKLTLFGVENKKVTDDLARGLSELGLLHTLFQVDVHTSAGYVEDGKRPAKPAEVRTLHLGNTQVTDAGLKYFADFPNVTDLYLSKSQATPAGLKQAAGFKNLGFLNLDSIEKSGDGLKHLADMKKLYAVYVIGGEMSEESLKQLTALKNLTALHLPITDDTLKALSEAGWLHLLFLRAKTADGKRPATDDEIASLDLSRSQFHGEGLKYVAQLKNLTTLDLSSARLTAAWVEHFQKLAPKCKIVK